MLLWWKLWLWWDFHFWFSPERSGFYLPIDWLYNWTGILRRWREHRLAKVFRELQLSNCHQILEARDDSRLSDVGWLKLVKWANANIHLQLFLRCLPSIKVLGFVSSQNLNYAALRWRDPPVDTLQRISSECFLGAVPIPVHGVHFDVSLRLHCLCGKQ